MSSYNELLNGVNEYLNREEIVDDEETISAIKLYDILDEYLFNLKDTLDVKAKSFSNQLNEKYNSQKKTLISLIKDRKKQNNTEYECGISTWNDKLSLIIRFEDKKKHCTIRSIYIGLDEESNELYIDYNRGIDKKIIEENYETILNLLTEIFKYKDYILDFKGTSAYKDLEFNDDIFKIKFRCSEFGTVERTITVNEDNDSVASREYINKESINEYIKNNKYEILKRTSIKIDSLEEPFKSIVKNSLKKDAKVIKHRSPFDTKK